MDMMRKIYLLIRAIPKTLYFNFKYISKYVLYYVFFIVLYLNT